LLPFSVAPTTLAMTITAQASSILVAGLIALAYYSTTHERNNWAQAWNIRSGPCIDLVA
jgi:hypothetical protein